MTWSYPVGHSHLRRLTTVPTPPPSSRSAQRTSGHGRRALEDLTTNRCSHRGFTHRNITNVASESQHHKSNNIQVLLNNERVLEAFHLIASHNRGGHHLWGALQWRLARRVVFAIQSRSNRKGFHPNLVTKVVMRVASKLP